MAMARRLWLSFAVALVGLFCSISVLVPEAAAVACPKLKPVTFDEKWFFKSQPPEGFFFIATSGTDTIPKYTAKPMKEIKSSKKVCGVTKALLNGKELLTIPPIECDYNTPGQYYCGAATGASAGAMRSAGFNLPKAFTNTIVDTDNKTFVALGSCMDGADYQWAIYTPLENNKKLHASTLTALHITKEVVNDSANKKYKTGRAIFTKGACKKAGEAGIAKVSEGLTGILGGGK